MTNNFACTDPLFPTCDPATNSCVAGAAATCGDMTNNFCAGGTCVDGKCSMPTTTVTPTPTPTTATTPDPNANKPGSETPTQPPPEDPPGVINKALGSVVIWIMKLFAWFAGIAMIVLNYSVALTVIGMGEHVKNLTGVGVTWRILRDIGNILFIFGFLAVGISVILNSEWYGGGMKKMLPMLIVGAVFLNFSLFITEAIIDTGNLFATQIYTQINNGQKLTDPKKEVLSDKIMGTLGLQTTYSNDGIERIKKEHAGNILFIGFMGIILCIVIAFVMFSLAFILIFRFVILLLLIILAPLGFAGLAIPQLKSTAKKWWDTLIEQTITAPVLILLLYIALSVITDANFLLGSNRDWLGAIPGKGSATNIQGFASLLISFLIAMGLLVAVVIVSKKLSAFGAGMAMKAGSKLSGASIAARMPGFVGRHTVGRAGKRLAAGLGNTWVGGTALGRYTADTLEKKVGGASFDVRNTALGKEAAGVGLNLGKGQKGGYNADFKESVASYERAGERKKGRKQTDKEKKEIADAKAKVDGTTEKHTKAEKTHATAVEEHDKQEKEVDRLREEQGQLTEHKTIKDLEIARQTLLVKAPPSNAAEFDERKAETDRLEKELERERRQLADHETTRNLAEAQTNLVTKKTARDAAKTELTQAKKDKVNAIEAANKLAGESGTAALEKNAKEAYTKKLENKSPWWSPTAGPAAKNIMNNFGKSKEQREVEALLSKIKEKSGSGEDVEKKEEKKEEKK